jgi:hypothetical protein
VVSSLLPIKDSDVPFVLCDICKENKSRSRKFHSMHALRWHIKHEHGNEIR